MPTYNLYAGTAQRSLTRYDTMFADPPDNIGLDYDEYSDKKEEWEYRDLLYNLFYLGADTNTCYVSFNSKWMSLVGYLLYSNHFMEDQNVKWLIQGFTFGQHNQNDLANNFRPIVRIRKGDAKLYPDAVRIESWRMRHGDKRTNPAGRVPGDVWFKDFLEYARVTGNSKQRRSWHPTQLHEGLVEDCLLMSTPPGGSVLDPFAGTGTTLRVCMANGWSCASYDISRNYCERIAAELGFEQLSDTHWGLET